MYPAWIVALTASKQLTAWSDSCQNSKWLLRFCKLEFSGNPYIPGSSICLSLPLLKKQSAVFFKGKTPFLNINAIVNCHPHGRLFSPLMAFLRLQNGLGMNISEETLVCPKRSFLWKNKFLRKRQKLSMLLKTHIFRYSYWYSDPWQNNKPSIGFQHQGPNMWALLCGLATKINSNHASASHCWHRAMVSARARRANSNSSLARSWASANLAFRNSFERRSID